ncbi:putative cytochrome P450 monooxygenase [Podospora didyma]|uniref:Cytochrome P450 monooxygenase n=1 Tax=Podospora didyma TaxID=330526 RepID=A0AAE0NBQ3_9PEZI|nr:putative cytochrome P450 monooxygenase [Podospora didyma]
MATISKGSIPSSIPWAWGTDQAMTPDPSAKPLPYLIAALLLAFALYSFQGYYYKSTISSPTRLSHLNPRGPFDFTDTRPKKVFMTGAKEMIGSWFRENPDTPVRFISDSGETLLLPPSMANEVRSDPRLDLASWMYKRHHGHIPGFEGFGEGGSDSHVVQAVITKDLTKYLNKVTEPLAEETALAVAELLPTASAEDREWHTDALPFRETALRLVARISSRVFLGKELCRNEAWLRITRNYTMDGFRASQELRMWPGPLRLIVHWFLPSCHKVRAYRQEAHRVIEPVLEARHRLKQAGTKGEVFNDALEWFEQTSAGRRYDPVGAQLFISVAAIHTTTDLLCQVLIDLVTHPNIIPPLREEISGALREHGWKKTALHNMKLLDSVIKETQRVKPIGVVVMNRRAQDDVTLSNGTKVRKDGNIAVSMHGCWDSEFYENPEKWDGYRFLRLRDTPGREHTAQLVSTSPNHLGFGHGEHACPGRFFAAAEVKITLVYLLLNYDWRLPEGVVPKIYSAGFGMGTDPFVKVQYRRREPEVDIASL